MLSLLAVKPLLAAKQIISKLNWKLIGIGVLILIFVAQFLTIVYWRSKYEKTCDNLQQSIPGLVLPKQSCESRIKELRLAERDLYNLKVKSKEATIALDQVTIALQTEKAKQKETTVVVKERIRNVIKTEESKTCIGEPHMRVVIDSVRDDQRH
jgi:hypothetical protein